MLNENKFSLLWGRQVVWPSDYPLKWQELPFIQRKAAVLVGKTKIQCQRCGAQFTKERTSLPDGSYYCPACILLGRLTSRDTLYTISEPNNFSALNGPILKWQGQLTRLQRKCAYELIASYQHKQNHLLWAVTGAGKTEILYPLIIEALKNGERICLAAPRLDVCTELYLRLHPLLADEVSLVLLHGESQQLYAYTQFVICTTHQLLNFKEAFDVLVIDEVDAFPYQQSLELQNGAQAAVKKQGMKVYLTATPNRRLEKQIKHGKLQASLLFSRYHGGKLPEPKIILVRQLAQQISHQQLSLKLKKYLKKWQKQQQPFLVFVPQIEKLLIIEEIIQKVIPKAQGATVHASDPKRSDKVQQLRQGKYQYLVTTTILERGVTFKGVQVVVLFAEHEQFQVPALIQIAGRVGRDAKQNTGDVIFVASTYTRKLKKAVKMIRRINDKAGDNHD
ncbi:helicase-related protein [Ligilactobacillus ceti]|uniref:helicase-related protein n=1 Tax=Ligilactobacillus ceti TaxID=395085 RepID=UPI0004866D2C|nr:helicase-related protein [Ligilactobacillus ceti]